MASCIAWKRAWCRERSEQPSGTPMGLPLVRVGVLSRAATSSTATARRNESACGGIAAVPWCGQRIPQRPPDPCGCLRSLRRSACRPRIHRPDTWRGCSRSRATARPAPPLRRAWNSARRPERATVMRAAESTTVTCCAASGPASDVIATMPPARIGMTRRDEHFINTTRRWRAA
jgi:hypothetical protein